MMETKEHTIAVRIWEKLTMSGAFGMDYSVTDAELPEYIALIESIIANSCPGCGKEQDPKNKCQCWNDE